MLTQSKKSKCKGFRVSSLLGCFHSLLQFLYNLWIQLGTVSAAVFCYTRLECIVPYLHSYIHSSIYTGNYYSKKINIVRHLQTDNKPQYKMKPLPNRAANLSLCACVCVLYNVCSMTWLLEWTLLLPFLLLSTLRGPSFLTFPLCNRPSSQFLLALQMGQVVLQCLQQSTYHPLLLLLMLVCDPVRDQLLLQEAPVPYLIMIIIIIINNNN